MAARNTSDIYARSDESGVLGSKIVISPVVLPIKSTSAIPTVVGDYALLFDDVAYNAAANTYSGVGVTTAGDVTIKSKAATIMTGAGAMTLTAGASTLVLPATTTAPVLLNGFAALGGPAGVSGFINTFTFSNLVNCNTLAAFYGSYAVSGRFCTIHFRMSANIAGAGVVQFDMLTDIQALRAANFGSSSNGNAMMVSLEPAAFYGEAVAGAKTIRFTSGAGFTIATPDIFTGYLVFDLQ